MTDETKDNSGGYCNPPVKHRFQKGRSGNPKGRPKGTKNLKTDFDEELNELVCVKEDGVQKTMTKQRAVVKNTVAKGMHGDLVAAGKVFEQINRFAGQDNNVEQEQDQDLTAEDQSILDDFLAQEFNQARGSETETYDQIPAPVDPAEAPSREDGDAQTSYQEIDDQEEDDDR